MSIKMNAQQKMAAMRRREFIALLPLSALAAQPQRMTADATLFMMTDEPVMKAFGWLRSEALN